MTHLWSGPPHTLLKVWQAQRLSLVISPEILAEYSRVAQLLAKKYPGVDLSHFMDLLTLHAEMHTPTPLSAPICRDTDEDKFIACALASEANHIISGDNGLLSLKQYHSIQILSPADFAKRFL